MQPHGAGRTHGGRPGPCPLSHAPRLLVYFPSGGTILRGGAHAGPQLGGSTAILIHIADIVLPVFIVVAAGFLFGKVRRLDLTPINDFVIYVSTPCLIVSSLSRNPIEGGLIGKVFLSVALVVGVSLAAGYVVVRALGLRQDVYLPPVAFANTGNMGLPLVLFAFGDAGFNAGILYMVGMTVVHYTVGVAILSFDVSRFEVFKLPLLYAAALGIVLSLGSWHLPGPLFDAVDLLGEATIPTMIFSLGYKLSEATLEDMGRSFLLGALRIVTGAAAGAAAAALLGLGGAVRGVVMLDAAMPPAVFNFVLAEKYGKDSKAVASVIMAGTLLSLATTPLILLYLLGG